MVQILKMSIRYLSVLAFSVSEIPDSYLGEEETNKPKNHVICDGVDGKGLNAGCHPCFGGFGSGLAKLMLTDISSVLAQSYFIFY